MVAKNSAYAQYEKDSIESEEQHLYFFRAIASRYGKTSEEKAKQDRIEADQKKEEEREQTLKAMKEKEEAGGKENENVRQDETTGSGGGGGGGAEKKKKKKQRSSFVAGLEKQNKERGGSQHANDGRNNAGRRILGDNGEL